VDGLETPLHRAPLGLSRGCLARIGSGVPPRQTRIPCLFTEVPGGMLCSDKEFSAEGGLEDVWQRRAHVCNGNLARALAQCHAGVGFGAQVACVPAKSLFYLRSWWCPAAAARKSVKSPCKFPIYERCTAQQQAPTPESKTKWICNAGAAIHIPTMRDGTCTDSEWACELRTGKVEVGQCQSMPRTSLSPSPHHQSISTGRALCMESSIRFMSAIEMVISPVSHARQHLTCPHAISSIYSPAQVSMHASLACILNMPDG
jgi:hypothetical protein